LLLHGCSNPNPGFRDVVKAFKGSVDQPEKATQSANVNVLRVFGDCSVGMRGYTVPQSSGIPSNYVRVLQRMSNGFAGYDTWWHCADAPKVAVPARDILQGAYKPFPHSTKILFDAATDASPNAIDIVVSDFAVLGGGDGATGLSAALRQLSEKKRSLALWAFRSSYYGDYPAVSSQCAGKKVPLRVGQSLPGIARPFYLLISAPDRGSLEKWAKGVERTLLPSERFSVGQPPVEVGALIEQKVGTARLVHGPERDQNSVFPMRFYSVFTVDHSRAFDISFDWKGDPKMSADRAGLSISPTEIRQWPVTATTIPVPSKGLGVEVLTGPETVGHFRYVVHFPAVSGKSWHLYQIPIASRDGAAPKWLADWSSQGDCESSSGNKTINLSDLGQQVAAAFVGDRPFVDHYIAVRRE